MSVSAAFPDLRARHASLNRAALRGVFTEQQADAVVAGRPIGDEWDARLARTMYVRNMSTARDVALRVAAALGASGYDPDVMDEWLTINAEIGARAINDSTREALAAAQDKDSVFQNLLRAGVAMYAASMVTTAANFGAQDAAVKSGGRTKTWVGSGKATSRHKDVSGQTVPVEESFSNGMAFPGDWSGGADQVAGCECSLRYN